MGITEFFFLTLSDRRYHAKYRNGNPSVQRVTGARTADEPDPLLGNGGVVGIGSFFVCVFDIVDGYGRDFERMPYTQLGDRTDPPVAFFLRTSDLGKCASSKGLKRYDPRYRQQTLDTFLAIGIDHPGFVLSQSVTSQFLAQTA